MMHRDEDNGETLGRESVDGVIAKMERYCECERHNIELRNQGPVAMLRAELSLLFTRKQDLEQKLREAPPVGDLRGRRRRARCYWAVAALLTVAGLYFTALTFDPFRLGNKAYVYCLGIAVTVAFLGDLFLVTWGKEKLVKTIVSAAFAATLSSLVLLAVIRGDLLMQQVKSDTATVTIDGYDPAPASPNTFYEDTVGLLRLALALIALGIDLAAGLAVREALRYGSPSGDDPHQLTTELAEVHRQIVAKLGELTALENEASIFEAQFWRDFYRSMLTHTARSALSKLSILVAVGILLFVPAHARAAESLNLIILVDLSKSVTAKGPDGATDFEKNLKGVEKVLMQVPAGSRVTVVGITDSSFAEPDILLSAQIPSDEGYFKERLTAARRQLLITWRSRSERLRPTFGHTDVIGALLVAGQIFQSAPAPTNALVIFSDMRQDTATLGLEKLSRGSVEPRLARVTAEGLIPSLKNVQVIVLGANAAGQKPSYWQDVRDFWSRVFEKAGAQLEEYSILRELPADAAMK